jgi:putative transcriptional regulator
MSQAQAAINDAYTALLLQYAAGSLDLAQRLVVATHLSISPQARHVVRRYEELGAALLTECCDPVEMSARSLDRVLNMLENRPAPQPKPQPQVRMLGDIPLPECLYNALREHALEQMRWQRLCKGIQSCELPVGSRRSHATFVRFDPGAFAPPRRRVTEVTLVIKGSFSNETGTYQYGDLVITESEEPGYEAHACQEEGCVNLTASSAPMRLSGLAALLHTLLR